MSAHARSGEWKRATEPFGRDRRFWVTVLDAIPIGLMAGGAGLLFTWTVGRATNRLWPDDVENDFLGGELWWIAPTVGAGLLAGLLRRWLPVPAEPAGALESIADRHVDQRSAIPMIVVSWISLVGGVSPGPFDAGVRSGGAVGEWFSDRVRADDETREFNTLVGSNAAIGGSLTSPILATLLVTELNPERPDRYCRSVAPSLIASVVRTREPVLATTCGFASRPGHLVITRKSRDAVRAALLAMQRLSGRRAVPGTKARSRYDVVCGSRASMRWLPRVCG